MTSEAELPVIEVFSRPGCHLCEELIEELLPLVRGKLKPVVHNVDDDAAWQEAYGLKIPVVVFEGRSLCEFKLDRDAVLRIVDRL